MHDKHQAVEKAYQEGVSMEATTDLEAEMFAGEVYTRLFEYIDRLPRRQRTTILLVMEGKRNASPSRYTSRWSPVNCNG